MGFLDLNGAKKPPINEIKPQSELKVLADLMKYAALKSDDLTQKDDLAQSDRRNAFLDRVYKIANFAVYTIGSILILCFIVWLLHLIIPYKYEDLRLGKEQLDVLKQFLFSGLIGGFMGNFIRSK